MITSAMCEISWSGDGLTAMQSSSLQLPANQNNTNIRLKRNNKMHKSRLEATVCTFRRVKSFFGIFAIGY